MKNDEAQPWHPPPAGHCTNAINNNNNNNNKININNNNT